MEMISRRAYGFRNFKNYRLRVIALLWMGWDIYPSLILCKLLMPLEMGESPRWTLCGPSNKKGASPKELTPLKLMVDTAGIEPATFRFVV